METGCDALLERRVGEEVTGDLLEGELIERHVLVEGVDHPISPRPKFTVAVDLVAV